MNYVEEHKNICVSLNTLCVSVEKLHEESDAVSVGSLDEMLTNLSDMTLILTPAHITMSASDQIELIEKKKKIKFIVIRMPNRFVNVSTSSSEGTGSLIQKLASLNVSSKGLGPPSPSSIRHQRSSIEKGLYSLAARAIHTQILERQKHIEALPSYLSNTSTHQEVQNDRSIFSPLRYVSTAKSIFNRIVLGSHYDQEKMHGGIHNDDLDEDVDDAILHAGRDHVDDILLDDGHLKRLKKQVSKHLIEQDFLSLNDVMWNTDLIIECWDILIQYAQDQVKKRDHGYDEHQTTILSVGGTHHTGIFLYRHGHERRSFYQFCKDCSKVSDDSHAMEALSSTNALDLMMALLIETNKAFFPTMDEDVVVLLPMTTLGTDLSNCANQVSEADLCVFKISETVQMTERNIDKLSRQAEEMRSRAFVSKTAGNTKHALLYMKRCKDYTNEMERSSSLLLNLESGLITLKRAMNDKEVFNTYELMNKAMKAVRKDIDVSHVEDVISEIEDHTSLLNSLHGSIHQNPELLDDDLSDELLLKELANLSEGATGSIHEQIDSLEKQSMLEDAPPIKLCEQQEPKKIEPLFA